MLVAPALFSMAVFVVIFLLVSCAGLWLLRPTGDQQRAISRLRQLADEASAPPARRPTHGNWGKGLLLSLGAFVLSNKKNRVDGLREQLLRAGYLRSSAPAIFIGVKLSIMIGLAILFTLLPLGLGLLSWRHVPLAALSGCVAGMLGSSWWLSAQVKARQRLILRALPDALDMLVLCLESGLSFNAGIQNVADELQAVHPTLSLEMNIIQREIQLGLSAGTAFKKFGERCGLPDVRDLACVILQSEHFGASITKALRIYADTSRTERHMKAEEVAQKAAVKILFPTMLFIFPAIFIVLLGPAAFQIAKLFSR